jgi:hypothetical protein
MGLKTREVGRLPLGLRRSRTRFCSKRSMLAARLALSALRVPSTTMASPLSRTTSRMKALLGRIFMRSVHQRNLRRGEG